MNSEIKEMKSLFYEPIKIKEKESNVLFWCCVHNGHDPKWDVPLWKMRGYESSEAHTSGLIENWNSVATNETIGFLLGDTIFGGDADERLKILFDKLSFKRLYVMSGNHYSGWRQVFMSCENNVYKTSAGKEVVFIPNYLEAIINGQAIVMSHYPILSWNGMGHGSWMLFGHVHGSLIKSELGKMYLEKGGKNYEVSVENCPFPATFSEIRHVMKQRDVSKVDHHGKDTKNPF